MKFEIRNPFQKKPVQQPLSQQQQSDFSKNIEALTGFAPQDIALYETALLHSSKTERTQSGQKINNERLEFLGDAVVDLVVAHVLYQRYPNEDEGFLTETRAKIVNTSTLDQFARKLGLPDLLTYDKRNQTLTRTKSIYGDALEALIGALFADCGYEAARTFVETRILQQEINFEKLTTTETNYKSKVYEWGQKTNHHIAFEQVEGTGMQGRKFTMLLLVNAVEEARASEYSKKAAEQLASALLFKKIDSGAFGPVNKAV